MRSLIQPRVIKAAAVATLFTTLACSPRLAAWPEPRNHLWLVWLTLAWAAFLLWSFVFAWQTKCTPRQIFRVNTRPAMWIAATVGGLCGAFFLHTLIDPTLRSVAAQEYPSTVWSWMAMTLFLLAFDQLFICFAPFAFFVRLFRNEKLSMTLTVLFGVFLLQLKIRSWSTELPLMFILELFAWRVLAGGLSVYFYVKGGTPLTWWWALLPQLRHLFDLSG